MTKKITKDDIDKIMELRDERGHSFKQIGEEVGFHRDTVSRIYREQKEPSEEEQILQNLQEKVQDLEESIDEIREEILEEIALRKETMEEGECKFCGTEGQLALACQCEVCGWKGLVRGW